jgi:hypothetical protein
MIEADHRHLFEAAQLGRLKPPVAENNLVVPIDPDGNHEAKLFLLAIARICCRECFRGLFGSGMMEAMGR